MLTMDARGCPVTGASTPALEHFERALEAFQLGRGNPLPELQLATAAAPEFAMARLFEAHLRLSGRDPMGTDKAAKVLAGIDFPRLNSRERGHVAALAAALAGEYDVASVLLGSLLAEYPRDVLALQVAHSCDYLRGEVRDLRGRIEAALPAWSAATVGYHSVLAMLAFGLEESGEYDRAYDAALRALELEPRNVRAHHTVAHVLEMRGRVADGAAWMNAREAHWAVDSPMATHHWWHYALFRLGAEDPDGALEIYDARLGAEPRATSDFIDASALLWRLHLRGTELGGRWRALAERWAPHAADAYCAFNDLHAMMAFVGAERWDLARALLAAQAQRILKRGTNSEMTRLVGLPACQAVLAFGRGQYAAAHSSLARLPPIAYRLGGSQAQRNVIDLTRAAAGDRALRKSRSSPPPERATVAAKSAA